MFENTIGYKYTCYLIWISRTEDLDEKFWKPPDTGGNWKLSVEVKMLYELGEIVTRRMKNGMNNFLMRFRKLGIGLAFRWHVVPLKSKKKKLRPVRLHSSLW